MRDEEWLLVRASAKYALEWGTRRGKRERGIGLTDASVGREEEEKKGLFFLLARAGLSSYLCSP